MDPRDFLDIANGLLTQPPSPAACRTIIGRSYYAAYNVASSMVEELGIPLDKKKDSHKEVLDILVSSENQVIKNACDSLESQKKVRKDADYDMRNTFVETVQKASMALRLAKEIIKKLDRV